MADGGRRKDSLWEGFEILPKSCSSRLMPPPTPTPVISPLSRGSHFTLASLHTPSVITLLTSGAGSLAVTRGRIKGSPVCLATSRTTLINMAYSTADFAVVKTKQRQKSS